MRPRAIAIIGAPLGAWALFGCLTLLQFSAGDAGALALAWGISWIAIAWLGSRRGGVSGSMRGGAILTSLFLPVPVYLVTLAAAWLALMPATVALPMFAILFSSAPLYFWVLALRTRRRHVTSGPMLVMTWNHYDSKAPSEAIPPRISTIRRAM